MSSPNASSRWPKCASARASRAGAEEARRDTMPGGGGALAAVHSGQDQAAAGQHDGGALLQPGLTCTGRTEAVLSSGARHRIWANFDRRHSSPRAPSDKMLTVWKLRLGERKRLPCEPAAGWLGVDSRRRLFAEERACRRASLTQSARSGPPTVGRSSMGARRRIQRAMKAQIAPPKVAVEARPCAWAGRATSRGERSRAVGLAPSAERCERPVARFGLDPPGGPAADCMAGRASGRQAGPCAVRQARF